MSTAVLNGDLTLVNKYDKIISDITNVSFNAKDREELKNMSEFTIVSAYDNEENSITYCLCPKNKVNKSKDIGSFAANAKSEDFVARVKICNDEKSEKYGQIMDFTLGVDPETKTLYTPEKAKMINNFSNCLTTKEISRSIPVTYMSMILNDLSFYTSPECNVRFLTCFNGEDADERARKATLISKQYAEYCKNHKNELKLNDYTIIPYSTSYSDKDGKKKYHMGTLVSVIEDGENKGKNLLFDPSGAFYEEPAEMEKKLGKSVAENLFHKDDQDLSYLISKKKIQKEFASKEQLQGVLDNSCTWFNESFIEYLLKLQDFSNTVHEKPLQYEQILDDKQKNASLIAEFSNIFTKNKFIPIVLEENKRLDNTKDFLKNLEKDKKLEEIFEIKGDTYIQKNFYGMSKPAIVDNKSVVEHGAIVYDGAVIINGAKVGNGAIIHDNALISGNVHIIGNVDIQGGKYVYDDSKEQIIITTKEYFENNKEQFNDNKNSKILFFDNEKNELIKIEEKEQKLENTKNKGKEEICDDKPIVVNDQDKDNTATNQMNDIANDKSENKIDETKYDKITVNQKENKKKSFLSRLKNFFKKYFHKKSQNTTNINYTKNLEVKEQTEKQTKEIYNNGIHPLNLPNKNKSKNNSLNK